MKEEIGPYVISELDLRKFGLILLASYRKIGDSDYEPLQDMIQKIRSRPLSEEMLKKENLDVALVAAYESGMKEGARKERGDVLELIIRRYEEKKDQGIVVGASTVIKWCKELRCKGIIWRH